jgi:hypothetical protein
MGRSRLSQPGRTECICRRTAVLMCVTCGLNEMAFSVSRTVKVWVEHAVTGERIFDDAITTVTKRFFSTQWTGL